MINVSFNKHTIAPGQLMASHAIANLLRTKLEAIDKWIVGTNGKDYYLYYDLFHLVTYNKDTNKLYWHLSVIKDSPWLISKFNSLLKLFNIRCGLRDGEVWVKQLEGFPHIWSYVSSGDLSIDLGRTRACTIKHLWFMSYC